MEMSTHKLGIEKQTEAMEAKVWQTEIRVNNLLKKIEDAKKQKNELEDRVKVEGVVKDALIKKIYSTVVSKPESFFPNKSKDKMTRSILMQAEGHKEELEKAGAKVFKEEHDRATVLHNERMKQLQIFMNDEKDRRDVLKYKIGIAERQFIKVNINKLIN